MSDITREEEQYQRAQVDHRFWQLVWFSGGIELGRRLFGIIWNPETATDEEKEELVWKGRKLL